MSFRYINQGTAMLDRHWLGNI